MSLRRDPPRDRARPVRCRRCRRLRHALGDDWREEPTHPGEVLGICATCAEIEKRLQEQRYAREMRASERRRAKGFGPMPPGVDPFKGFREKEEDK